MKTTTSGGRTFNPWQVVRWIVTPIALSLFAIYSVRSTGLVGYFLCPVFCFICGALVAGDIARVKPFAGLMCGFLAGTCFLFFVDPPPTGMGGVPSRSGGIFAILGLMLLIAFLGSLFGTCVAYASTCEE